MDGILIINKPKGWTSFDVVAKIRGKLKPRRIGHTGTLDPAATGVLVLCLGRATKLAQRMLNLDKEYVAEITLGAISNTDDIDGQVVHNPQAGVKSRLEVEQALKRFQGVIQQMPPQFSAKKVKGRRAYDIAREGKSVELKPVEVTIREIEILDYKWPVLKVRVFCSKGTYLRSLARDLGQVLGVGGYLTALERTKVGQYTLDKAVTVEEAEEKHVIPVTVYRM